MKKKKFTHACRMKRTNTAEKRHTGKKVSPLHRGVNSKALRDIYDRYYREQVSSLYRAAMNMR